MMLNRNHQKDAEKTSVYHYLSRILPTYFFGGDGGTAGGSGIPTA